MDRGHKDLTFHALENDKSIRHELFEAKDLGEFLQGFKFPSLDIVISFLTVRNDLDPRVEVFALRHSHPGVMEELLLDLQKDTTKMLPLDEIRTLFIASIDAAKEELIELKKVS
jgi:hypothetical protein